MIDSIIKVDELKKAHSKYLISFILLLPIFICLDFGIPMYLDNNPYYIIPMWGFSILLCLFLILNDDLLFYFHRLKKTL